MSKVMHEDEDIVQRTIIQFTQTSHVVRKYIDGQLLSKCGVKAATAIALKLLTINDGKMTHTELAESTNTERHNITALIKHMKDENLVTTRRSRKDTRIVDIKITDKGHTLLNETDKVSTKAMRHVMRDLNDSELKAFEKTLLTIKQNSK